MKTLYLIRHATAGWDGLNTTDFARSLTFTGEQDARSLGATLKGQKIKPDLIISSPAKRAITTAAIIAAALNYASTKINLQALIYAGNVEALIEFIETLPSSYQQIFICGHNPNLTGLLQRLLPNFKTVLPTCGLVGIALQMQNWTNLREAKAQLLTFLQPSLHASD